MFTTINNNKYKHICTLDIVYVICFFLGHNFVFGLLCTLKTKKNVKPLLGYQKFSLKNLDFSAQAYIELF